MRLQNELLDSKFTHSKKKKPLTHNIKLLYIIFGCGIADPHFCNKLIIWGVGGGGGQQLPPPTLPAIYVFAFSAAGSQVWIHQVSPKYFTAIRSHFCMWVTFFYCRPYCRPCLEEKTDRLMSTQLLWVVHN